MEESRLLLLNGLMLIGDQEIGIGFEMRYRVSMKGMEYSSYYTEQELAMKRLGTDLVLAPVLKSGLSKKQKLPFMLTEGTWSGKHVRVFCAHDYNVTEKSDNPDYRFTDFGQLWRVEGQTRDGWSAFLSKDQLFQVLDDEDRVLGEVDKERTAMAVSFRGKVEGAVYDGAFDPAMGRGAIIGKGTVFSVF